MSGKPLKHHVSAAVVSSTETQRLAGKKEAIWKTLYIQSTNHVCIL